MFTLPLSVVRCLPAASDPGVDPRVSGRCRQLATSHCE